jgi:hypothetical protein
MGIAHVWPTSETMLPRRMTVRATGTPVGAQGMSEVQGVGRMSVPLSNRRRGRCRCGNALSTSEVDPSYLAYSRITAQKSRLPERSIKKA